MVRILLALLGFARGADQATVPPALAWLGLTAAMFFPAKLVGLVRGALGGYAVALDIMGLIAVAMIIQGTVRILFWGDDHTWLGWIRKPMLALRNKV